MPASLGARRARGVCRRDVCISRRQGGALRAPTVADVQVQARMLDFDQPDSDPLAEKSPI